MRILLDECVPSRVKRSLRYSNGQLLRRIDGQFDVFVTVDKSIQYQQNLRAYGIAFVLLRARSNDIVDIEPLVLRLITRLSEVEPGRLLVID